MREKPGGPLEKKMLLHVGTSFGPAVSCVKLLSSCSMTPEDVKNLRVELDCTAKELAAVLGVEQETILAWERGELFPTKRFVTKMKALQSFGKSAIPRKPRRTTAASSPMAVLADPAIWLLIRKLVTHADLRREVSKLAETYPDPADESSDA